MSWKNIFKYGLTVFKPGTPKENEDDPLHRIKISLTEIEQDIERAQKALHKANANHEKLSAQTQRLQFDSVKWQNEAVLCLKQEDETGARKALEKKALVDKQYEEYKLLLENSDHTLLQLHEHLHRLNTRHEEVKGMEAILAAKLSTVETQKEIADQLRKLNHASTSDLGDFEREINKTSNQSDALAELIARNKRGDKNLTELESESHINQNYHALKHQLSLEEEQRKKEEEEKKHQKISKLFEQNPKLNEDKKKEKDSKINEKEQLLNQFSNEHSDPKIDPKKDLLDHFSQKEIKKEDDKLKKMKDFFKDN